jgi:hypothetical protein
MTLFVVNKRKKLEKVKPPFTEQVQKYGCFQNFPLGEIALVIRFLVKFLQLKERQQLHYFISVCLFPSSDGS